jgi:carbonic anhydrase
VTHITDDEVREFAKAKNPAAAADVDKIDFGLWRAEHLEESVREDVRKLRQEKSLDGMEVLGFVLETQTGAVREIEV